MNSIVGERVHRIESRARQRIREFTRVERATSPASWAAGLSGLSSLLDDLGEVTPEPLPGVRPFGLFVDLDVGDAREPDEQRGVPGVGADQLDADGEPL